VYHSGAQQTSICEACDGPAVRGMKYEGGGDVRKEDGILF
jgi:hypothetical protein